MRHFLLLALVLFSAVSAVADTRALIRSYYNCGMSKYLPGSGALLSVGDEEQAAINLLNKNCVAEFEALKQELFAFEKQNNEFEKTSKIKLTPFSAATTLQGHVEYARDDIRMLMRLDRLTHCWQFRAGEYVRGTKESSEVILDASLLSCPEEHGHLREILKVLAMDDAQLERTLQIARQRVTKYILDERLKQKGK